MCGCEGNAPEAAPTSQRGPVVCASASPELRLAHVLIAPQVLEEHCVHTHAHARTRMHTHTAEASTQQVTHADSKDGRATSSRACFLRPLPSRPSSCSLASAVSRRLLLAYLPSLPSPRLSFMDGDPQHPAYP